MSATPAILSFPAVGLRSRRALQRNLLNALRTSESPVILDFTGHHTLDHEDIDLILECIAEATGRDTPLELVAGSRAVRIVLDVIRVSSLVQVFDSLEEATAVPEAVTSKVPQNVHTIPFELPRSA